MENKTKKKYWEWVFTRWYFYVSFLFILGIDLESFIFGIKNPFYLYYSIGVVFGTFLMALGITAMFYDSYLRK